MNTCNVNGARIGKTSQRLRMVAERQLQRYLCNVIDSVAK